MASAVIGALRVNLGLDSAQFTTGAKSAQSALDRLASTITKFGAVAGAALGAGLAAVGNEVRKTIESIKGIEVAAQVSNAGIEEFQKLAYAAKTVGIESEKLSDIYKDVTDRIGDFWATGGGPMADFFETIAPKVGITAEAFRNLSGPQALQLYYDTLVKAGASQQDLVFYLEAMASDATKLIPLLQDGGMRFKELGDQAERAGVIISTQTAQAALAFSSNLLQLGAVKDGIITKITAQLLPALELLSEKFLAVANDGEAIEAMSTGVIKALHFISNEVGQLALLSSRLSAEFAGISEAFSRLGSGDFSGAWAAFQEGQEASAAMAEKLRGQIDQIFDGVAVSQGAIQRRIDTAFGEIGVSAGKRFTESLAQNISSESAKKAIDPIVREAASIFDATRTPLENYQSQIARLNELLAAGAINQDTYNRAVIQAQDAFEKAENAGQKADKTFSQIGNSVASTFSNAFQGLLDGSKKVKDVLADLLKQLASMAMNRAFQSIFGAIFGGGGSDPWAGLRIPNFARGGTIMPGGGGGIDSQLVMFRKSPNERVDISKPNQTAAMGSESYAPIYNIDARGAQKGVGEEIAAALKAYDRGRLSRLAGDLPELRRRGGA